MSRYSNDQIQSIIRAIVFVFLLATSSIAFGEDQPTYHAHVNGLACPFCVYGLERSLGKIEGVETVIVSLKTGLIQIAMRDNLTLDESLVRETIEDAGFTLEAYERASPIASPAADGE